MAGHFFFSTICWWRAEMSLSPPGGKACQYIRFLSGQGWAWAWPWTKSAPLHSAAATKACIFMGGGSFGWMFGVGVGVGLRDQLVLIMPRRSIVARSAAKVSRAHFV